MSEDTLNEKFKDFLRPSFKGTKMCASDLADIYQFFGPCKLVEFLKEMISIEKYHLDEGKFEIDRGLLDNKIAKDDLDNFSIVELRG